MLYPAVEIVAAIKRQTIYLCLIGWERHRKQDRKKWGPIKRLYNTLKRIAAPPEGS
jgi:hypothetical protein